MIAIRIPYTPQDLALELLNEATLLLRGDVLYSLPEAPLLLLHETKGKMYKPSGRPGNRTSVVREEVYVLPWFSPATHAAPVFRVRRASVQPMPDRIKSDRAVGIDTAVSTYVVSEDVLYELQRVNGHNLFKDLLLFLDTGSLNLLLDESRAMLVTTELHDVAVNVLRREGQQPQLKHVRKSGTLSSHLRLLFARNSSSSGLRIATR